jgi:hypothetical protein
MVAWTLPPDYAALHKMVQVPPLGISVSEKKFRRHKLLARSAARISEYWKPPVHQQPFLCLRSSETVYRMPEVR